MERLAAFLDAPSTARQDALIDTLVGFEGWHFSLPGHPKLVVMDSRTRRWRSERSLNRPSGLMDREALTELQQGLLGEEAVAGPRRRIRDVGHGVADPPMNPGPESWVGRVRPQAEPDSGTRRGAGRGRCIRDVGHGVADLPMYPGSDSWVGRVRPPGRTRQRDAPRRPAPGGGSGMSATGWPTHP